MQKNISYFSKVLKLFVSQVLVFIAPNKNIPMTRERYLIGFFKNLLCIILGFVSCSVPIYLLGQVELFPFLMLISVPVIIWQAFSYHRQRLIDIGSKYSIEFAIVACFVQFFTWSIYRIFAYQIYGRRSEWEWDIMIFLMLPIIVLSILPSSIGVAVKNVESNNGSIFSVADEITKLAKLKHDGLITENEYQLSKKKITG